MVISKTSKLSNFQIYNLEQMKLQECVSICAMVAAYDSGTTRANEMLTVLDAILPLFLKQIVQDKKTEVMVEKLIRN